MTRSAPIFDTSPSRLLLDLYRANKDARRHKRQKGYQLSFERNVEAELLRLRDAILSGRWQPGPSTCFIIHDPKMREVFAAQFKDRVVHHLLYNYIAPLLEPGFVEDSYSCIKGRGTHYGINRLEEKIKTASNNYSRPCYILKLDIAGYFMHIDRARLLAQGGDRASEDLLGVIAFGQGRTRIVKDVEDLEALVKQIKASTH